MPAADNSRRRVAASFRAPGRSGSSAGLRFLRPRKGQAVALVDDVFFAISHAPIRPKADEADLFRSRLVVFISQVPVLRVISEGQACRSPGGLFEAGFFGRRCVGKRLQNAILSGQYHTYPEEMWRGKMDEADQWFHRAGSGPRPGRHCRAVIWSSKAARCSTSTPKPLDNPKVRHADHGHHRQRPGVQCAVELYGACTNSTPSLRPRPVDAVVHFARHPRAS